MKKQKTTCNSCLFFEAFKSNTFITHCKSTPCEKSITGFFRVSAEKIACEKYKIKKKDAKTTKKP